MTWITVEIINDGMKCGDCPANDGMRNHCRMFDEFIDDDYRCCECVNAEDICELNKDEDDC